MKDQLEALVTQMIDKGLYLEEAMCEMERRFILTVLERTRGIKRKPPRRWAFIEIP